MENFLAPRFTAVFLDTFLTRSAILQALQETIPFFSGTLLDVGCGHMPYKSLLTSPPSQVRKYIGVDIDSHTYQKRDLVWDGRILPLKDRSIDCVIATEVFEHCPKPELIMQEIRKVLKPGGQLFFTVPFLWPLHDVPHDEYRYTPFSLDRHLRNSGFGQIKLKAWGGWDASLAQMIGLWVRRRPMSLRKRQVLSRLALPVVRYLLQRDHPPQEFGEGSMITGLAGIATKPAA